MTRPMIVILRTVLCRSLVEYIIALVNISYKHVRCLLDWFRRLFIYIYFMLLKDVCINKRNNSITETSPCEKHPRFAPNI